MMGIIHADYWRKARTEYMDAARACRDALTRADGYWCYERTDPRVKIALGAWVQRARNAHAIALGRRPVMPNVIIIQNDKPTRYGAAFAQ